MVSALAWLIAGKPVNEVALSLGYDNASSFATMFRRVTGQPPSFYHQPDASEKGLRQHVSEMNVAFMALLCVNAGHKTDNPGMRLRLQVPYI